MPHNGYPSQYMDSAMTLDELEEKTGFDFFVNLPEQISEKLAEYVEETKDNFWYN